MGRSKKNEVASIEAEAVVSPQNESQSSDEIRQITEPSVKEDKEAVEVPPHVAELMRLYPQYEEFWVTSRGFVRPVGTPKYLLRDAVLYKNKFFNK